MNRTQYYQQMQSLAREKRHAYEIVTASINIRLIQRIYKAEGIKLDRRSLKSTRIRAAYFCDGDDCSVLLKKSLPREPKIFSLIHELKHHYVDRDAIENGQIRCGDYNAHELIEKSAEIFAAEFIYPEAEMRQHIQEQGVDPDRLSAQSVVMFKSQCPAPVSYSFLVKRFEWFGFCERGEFGKVQFRKLEEELFGTPLYKQDWFKRHRARKKARQR